MRYGNFYTPPDTVDPPKSSKSYLICDVTRLDYHEVTSRNCHSINNLVSWQRSALRTVAQVLSSTHII